MTWTKFDSLRRGVIVLDKGYKHAEGNKRSYTTTYIAAPVLGLAITTLINAFNISLP
jgi:surface antigen